MGLPFPLTHALEMRTVLAGQHSDAGITDEINSLFGEQARLDGQVPGLSKSGGSVSASGSSGGTSTTTETTTTDSYELPKTVIEGTPKGPFGDYFDGTGPGNAEFKPLETGTVIYAIPVPPTGLEYSYVPAETLTFTQGAAIIDSNGQRLTTIDIRHEIGLAHRLGSDHTGAARFWAGPRLFAEMKLFLKKYWEINGDPQQKPVEIVYRDFKENLHVRVKPEPLKWVYDDTHKLAPRYELRLLAYDTAAAVPSSFLRGLLKDLLEGVQKVEDFLDMATMWIEIARANVADGLNIVSEVVRGPLDAIDRMFESAQGMSRDIRNGFLLGRDMYKQVIGLADTAVFTLETFLQDFGISRGDAPWIEDAHASLRQAQDALSFAAVAQAYVEPQGPDTYIVRTGDTPQSIASATYGDPDAWQAIVAANKLEAPYINASGLPNTVKPGQEIQLPAVKNAPKTSNTIPRPREALTAEERLFGIDVYRGESSEWEVSASGDDIRLARGQRAVEQSINARFATIRGRNLAFPRLGLPGLVGQPSFPTAAALQLAYMQEEAAADTRVEAVIDPTGLDAGSSVTLQVGIRLTGNREIAGVQAISTLTEAAA